MTISRPSRQEPVAVASLQPPLSVSNRLRQTTIGWGGGGAALSRTRLIVPSLRSATSTIRPGSECGDQRDRVVSRRQGASETHPGALHEHDGMRWAVRDSPPEVGDGERREGRALRPPSAAPTRAGASGVPGHGVSVLAGGPRQYVGVGGCVAFSGSNDCTGLRAATVNAESFAHRASSPVPHVSADLGAGTGVRRNDDGHTRVRSRAHRTRVSASPNLPWSSR